MRIAVVAATAALLLAPAAIPAQAHHGMAIQHQEFAMAKKKKTPKKTKTKKEEHMRAVPSR